MHETKDGNSSPSRSQTEKAILYLNAHRNRHANTLFPDGDAEELQTAPRTACDTGMHVSFIINSLRRSGAEGQLVKVAAGLVKHGWKVDIFSLLPVNDFEDELKVAGVGVTILSPTMSPSPLRLFHSLRRALSSDKARILVTFLYHADILGRLAGRAAGIPAIISSFRNEKFGGSIREGIMRLTRFIPRAFVANFSSAGELLVARGLAPAQRMHIIPNGVELTAESITNVRVLSEHASADTGNTKFEWLAIGRLEPQKDYRTMLDAYSQLETQNCRLRICGAGSARKELQQYAQSIGLGEDKVEFLGHRTDVRELLAESDGFVMSSAWEGMPNALMEAMATHVPVVATSVGGVPELLPSEAHGLLVPPSDSFQLAGAMNRLMRMSKSERRHLAQHAYEHVAASYSVHATVEAWHKLLLSFLR